MARFYINATGAPWQPRGMVPTTDGTGRSVSTANFLSSWSDAKIEAAFGVSAPDWSEPPAGQMVDTEDVTPDGSGGLIFTRTFKAKPSPNFATILAGLTAAAIRDKKEQLMGLVLEQHGGQFTRQEVIDKVKGLTLTQRNQLAAVVGSPLTGADLG